MQDKILKIAIGLSLALSLVSLSFSAVILKKTSGNKDNAVLYQNAGKPGGSLQKGESGEAIFEVNIPEKAQGFLGLAENPNVKTVEGEKVIQLRGHWTLDGNPTFDFIGSPNYEKASQSLPLKNIVITDKTKIEKAIISMSNGKLAKMDKQEVAFTEFKIESLNDPVFAVFSEQTSTAGDKFTATKLIIFPDYLKMLESTRIKDQK